MVTPWFLGDGFWCVCFFHVPSDDSHPQSVQLGRRDLTSERRPPARDQVADAAGDLAALCVSAWSRLRLRPVRVTSVDDGSVAAGGMACRVFESETTLPCVLWAWRERKQPSNKLGRAGKRTEQ